MQYEAILASARVALAEHPFADIIAQEAARRAGKRGDAKIIIDESGGVLLEIHYGGPSKDGSSGLPSLTALRKKAEDAGIDISDLGRAKRKIIARLEEGPKPKPKKKMRKTAPAVSPVRLVSVPDAEPPPKPKPGSMAAIAAEGAKAAENLTDFLATLDDIDD